MYHCFGRENNAHNHCFPSSVDKGTQLITSCFKSVRRQTFLIFGLNIVALALVATWLFADSSVRERIIRPNEYIFPVCKSFHNNLCLFITACGYFLTEYSILCTHLAFKSRSIPENFNETAYTGFFHVRIPIIR